MVSAKKFNFKRISVIIISVLFLFSAVSMVVTKAVYDSIFVRYDEPAAVTQDLQTLVQQRQVCQFYAGENLLTGYYYGTADPQNDHGLIVLAPGFHAGGDDYLRQIESLLSYGWGVFTFDATGTRSSEGENQVGFPQLIIDLEAALKYVEKSDRFGYNDLVLMGHSRGAYAACCALTLNEDISAVVCISGVNSAMEGVMQSSVNAVGAVSYGNYGFLWLYQTMLFGADTVDLQADEIISQSDVPVLVIHGKQDADFPTDKASIVSHAEEITSSRVEYLLLEGGHTDLLFDADGTANDALMESIHNFLIRHIS